MPQTVDRPSSVLVIAIFQLVFGGLGLLCDLYAGAAQAAGTAGMGAGGRQQQLQQDMTRDMERAMERRLPNYRVWTVGLLLLDVGLCFMMIGSGIGLLQMQPWGRTLALGGAILSIILKVFNVLLGITVTAPATKEVMAGYAPQMAGREAAAFMQVMDVTMGLAVWAPACFAIYPILVLAVLLQPGIAAAFGPRAALPEGDSTELQDRFRDGGSKPTGPDERFRG